MNLLAYDAHAHVRGLIACPDTPNWHDFASSFFICRNSSELHLSSKKLRSSGCCADGNPAKRPARCPGHGIPGFNGGFLRKKKSDSQGTELGQYESSTGSCGSLPWALADGSYQAGGFEATPTRPRSAPQSLGLSPQRAC